MSVVLVASLQGRFGNQVMQYLFCRAYAERCGLELRVDPWIGEKIFAIEHPRPDGRPLVRVNEFTIEDHTHPAFTDIEFRGYAQMQRCMIYTKRDAQRWLKFRAEHFQKLCIALPKIVCHRRAGDYFGYGYPVVSEASYRNAIAHFGFDRHAPLSIYCEENPTAPSLFPSELSFLPDFYSMVRARTLLRGNSTFSWVAGLLSNGIVLSPVIEGLEGGKEHDCDFVPGNWPRFCNLDFVQDLHVNP